MKSIIQGQNVEKIYHVVAEKDERGNFKHKPFIKETVKINYSDICEVDGEIVYNSELVNYCGHSQINLSEHETVNVLEEIYRVDLSAIVVHTDKILGTVETNKSMAEVDLVDVLKDYNEQYITQNKKLKEYCNVHKLDPRETDLDGLQKIVYKNDRSCVLIGAQEIDFGKIAMTTDRLVKDMMATYA